MKIQPYSFERIGQSEIFIVEDILPAFMNTSIGSLGPLDRTPIDRNKALLSRVQVAVKIQLPTMMVTSGGPRGTSL